jgi:hypothetical protein
LKYKAALNYRKFTFLEKDGDLLHAIGPFAKVEATGKPEWVLDDQAILMMRKAEILVTDSIFCLAECIRLCNITGITYMLNHSFIARLHMKLGEWCQWYRYLEHVQRNSNYQEKKAGKLIHMRIKTLLESLESNTIKEYLEPSYHFKRAERHFYLALSMHREGKAYHEDIMGNYFYLEDNFEDDFYHFCAALERLGMNTEKLRKNIKNIKKWSKAEDEASANDTVPVYPPDITGKGEVSSSARPDDPEDEEQKKLFLSLPGE